MASDEVDLSTMFERLDPDGRGYFDKNDLAFALDSRDDETEIEQLFDALDKNGDGKISFDEFVDGYSRIAASKRRRGSPPSASGPTSSSVVELRCQRRRRRKSSVAEVAGDRTARELFDLCDVNAKGIVNRSDVEMGCRLAGLDWSGDVIDSLFAELDSDGDGLLTCADFEREMSSWGGGDQESETSGVSSLDDRGGSGSAANFSVYESQLAWEDAVASTGNTFSGNSGTRLQQIWEEMKHSNPDVLGPFRDMMIVVSQEMKKQQEENNALRNIMKRQSAQYENDVRALDHEATWQLEAAEEEARAESARCEMKIREKLLKQVRDKEKEVDDYLEKLAQMESQIRQLGDKDFELNATRQQLEDYKKNNVWLQNQLEEREKSNGKSPEERDEVDKKSLEHFRKVSSGDMIADIAKLKGDLKHEKDKYSALNSELMRQLLDKSDEDTIGAQISEVEEQRIRRLRSKPSLMSLYVEARGPVRSGEGIVIHGEVSAEELVAADVYAAQSPTIRHKNVEKVATRLQTRESLRESDEEEIRALSRDSCSEKSKSPQPDVDFFPPPPRPSSQIFSENFYVRPFERGGFRSMSLRQRRVRKPIPVDVGAKTLEDVRPSDRAKVQRMSSLARDYKEKISTEETLQQVVTKLEESVADSDEDRTDGASQNDEEECGIAVLPDRVFKVVLAGSSGVGKTSWIDRICSGVFSVSVASTVGLDFRTKTVALDTGIVSIQFWDTAGQERYHSISRQYFRKADGVICMYDVTNWESLTAIRQWVAYIEDSNKSDASISLMILGNKTDLRDGESGRDFVATKRGAALAKEYGATFSEVSAFSGHNMEESLYQLTTLLISHQDDDLAKSVNDGGLILNKPVVATKKGCSC